MAKSSFFLFAVVVTVAVIFVMVAVQMNSHTPTSGIYGMNNTSANQTGQLLTGITTQAPVWVMPAVFIVMAVTLIGVFALVAKRR